MTEPRDPISRLEEAGARAAPAPDPDFADRLEARLRAVHPTATTSSPRRRPVGRALLVAAAAVVAIALVSLAVTSDDQADLRLTQATATDVILPDGTVVEGRAGLSLPDGALVQTGDEGSAAAGPVEVSSSSIGVVIDGELIVVDPDATPPTTHGTPPSTIRPTTTSSRPPTTTTVGSTTTAAPPATQRIELRVSRAGPEVVLRWTPYDRPNFARYVVLRIQGDDAEVIAERDRADATEARDRPPPGPTGYRIVVLDRAGRAIGGSPIVRL